MTRYVSHLKRNPIPKGLRIYEHHIEVAGLRYRKEDAISFVDGDDPWLELEVEPSNPKDKNAIMIFGCWRGWGGVRKEHIGYVPKEVAKVIVQGGFFSDIKPRLELTRLSDDDFVEVTFQIIGPAGRIEEFRNPPRSAAKRTTPKASPAEKVAAAAEPRPSRPAPKKPVSTRHTIAMITMLVIGILLGVNVGWPLGLTVAVGSLLYIGHLSNKEDEKR